MVKKNLVNKNVVRALSIGLSLAMMSQPLTAMAAEPDAPVTEPVKDAPALQPKTAAENAAAQAEVVKEAVDTNTANVQDVVDATKDAASKAEALDVNASDVNADVTAVENGKKAAEVVTELEKITSDTEGETTLVGLAQGVATAEENVEKPVKDVEEAVFGDKEKETQSLSEKLESANEAVEEASSKISGANSIDAVNSAYTDAANAVNDADEAVNAADEAVKNAEKELEVKEDEFNSLAEQYETALEAFNDKVDALNTAKANALKALGYSDAKGAEGLLDELASLYAEDEKEVADMEASLEVLKNNLAAAEKNYKQSGYGYIAALENVIAANGKAEYGTGNGEVRDVSIEKIEEKDSKVKATYRNLFKAIVQTYYVPEVLGGTFVKVEAAPVENGDYYYNGDTTNPNNKSTRGDVLRYFVVTYKDADGVEKTVKLNYKTANENKKDGYKGIVIFEKTEHTVLENQDIDNGISITNENGTEVKFGENDSKLTLFKDGKFYFKNADGSYTVLKQNGEKTTSDRIVDDFEVTDEKKLSLKVDEEKTNTDVLEDTEEVSYDYKDGRIVKTVKNSITTTTFTGRQLDAMDEKDYTEDVEDAKAEYLTQIQGIITGLRDNMTVIIAGKEYNNTHVIPDNAKAEDYGFVETTGSRQVERDETIGWNVDVEYKSDFTKKIRVDETYSWEIIRSLWGKGVDWKANEIVKEKVNGFKNNLSSEYTYDGSSDTVDGEWHLFSSGTIEGDIYINYHRTNNATKSIAVYNADKEAAKAAAKLDASVTGTANIGNDVTEKKSVVNATAGTAITKKVYPIVTTYGYASLDYILKTVTTQQNQVTYTESWAVEEETSHKEYRNDNWYSGDVISIKVDKNNNNAFVADYMTDGKSQNGKKYTPVKDTAKSEALVNKINEAKNKIGQYDAAIAAVNTAEEKVKAAEGEVETLKGLIEQISFSKKDNILAGLRSRLETAETELATAKAARDQLLENLRTLDGQRAQRITALTPAPSGEGGGETGGEGGATTPGATVLLPGAEAPLAAAPAMFVAAPGGAGAPAAAAAVAEDNTVTLTEQRTALSDAVPEAQTEQATENIDDGKTALAAAPVSEETLSWWWLLIIAVLGGAGYTMYRKFHNKKDEKTTN
jgi:HEPN domain-containing protein